ncbi:hypothetical protein RIF29_23794 [Crotalaria pallida]|uniref:PH domain-containing protein n=1 Tax=Crotalaria pallida TaxID=3830 RepID=A0AAN9I8S7_CROPI
MMEEEEEKEKAQTEAWPRREPLEFLWSFVSSHHQLSKALSPPITSPQLLSNNNNNNPSNVITIIPEDYELAGGKETPAAASVSNGSTFSFACSQTSHMIMDRLLSHPHSQQKQQREEEMSPRRLSHSSGPLINNYNHNNQNQNINNNSSTSCGGSLTDSPPLSPSYLLDDFHFNFNFNTNPNHNHYQYTRPNNLANINTHLRAAGGVAGAGGGKTVGRWLKDRKEKKKEETRAHNAQLHAAVSVAGVAAAVASIAAATAASSSSGEDVHKAKTDMAVASAATLVATQCVEAAEALGADREQLASVVSSAVNVRSAGDVMTLTAAAATALRGAATLKARALKEVWNVAAVIPVEKSLGNSGSAGDGSVGSANSSFSGELAPEENFLGICSRELLAKGCELLKRTRKGDLHWKIVSVYINRSNQVMVKMKSRHVAGTITKKKKNVVLEVIKDVPAWPGRHLLEGGENRRYFGLRTVMRGVVEFECRNQREYDVWTQGVSRLLSIAAEKNNRNRKVPEEVEAQWSKGGGGWAHGCPPSDLELQQGAV